MKLLQQKLLGAQKGEIRIMYDLGGWEEGTVIDTINIALDSLRAADIKIEDYTSDDRHRFDGMM